MDDCQKFDLISFPLDPGGFDAFYKVKNNKMISYVKFVR
jgi:hypothetical protein